MDSLRKRWKKACAADCLCGTSSVRGDRSKSDSSNCRVVKTTKFFFSVHFVAGNLIQSNLSATSRSLGSLSPGAQTSNSTQQRDIPWTLCDFLFRRKSAPSKFEVEGELSGIHNVRLFTYEELRHATDGFSDANTIGEGGFGPVYKARLKGGKHAAVKVLSAKSSQGVGEFLTEIKVISEIEHENLVKLFGCCVEEGHRILVYNYLENNSLADTLLGKNPNNIQFSWQARYRICVGVARGLAFLHDEIQPHIVHRDIKASNILLDKDLIPKISDFGLAKLIPANMTHVSTRVAGTLGYLAPEYAINGRLTLKADIYSFGVLLVEIVCGRNNTNVKLPVEEQYLLEIVWELHKRRKLVGLVDASLNGDFNAEVACRFLKVGLLCTQDNPRHRPSMSTVVKMLTGEQQVHDSKIKKPVLISDFLGLRVQTPQKSSESKSTSCAASSTSIISSENSGGGGGATTFPGTFDRNT